MWKIGPECAAQQAKWVSARADELRRAERLRRGHGGAPRRRRRMPRPRVPARPAAAAHQQRRRDQQHPGDDADRQHGGAPVVGADAASARTAPPSAAPCPCRPRPATPRGCGAGRTRPRRRCHHRRVEAAGGHADQHAEQQLELEQGRGASWRRPGRCPAAPRPTSTTGRVPQRSLSQPQPKADAPIARKTRVPALDTPVRDHPVSSDIGCRKTASEKQRAHGDAADQHAGADHHPAVRDLSSLPPAASFRAQPRGTGFVEPVSPA